MTSRFMFHLKFSRSEEYVHEHELYEVMRSRNLYQTQFEVRSGFKQRMRIIEKTEKSENNGFINTRKLFVQKMQQRMEQADKLKELMSVKVNKLMLGKGGSKKIERRYIPMHPAAGSTKLAFPDIVQKFKTPSPVSVQAPPRPGTGSLSHASGKAISEIASSLPYDAPSPSMAASTVAATTIFAKPSYKSDHENGVHDEQKPRLTEPQVTKCNDTNDAILETEHTGDDNPEANDELKYEEADVLPELRDPRNPVNVRDAYFSANVNGGFTVPDKNETFNIQDTAAGDSFATTDDLESQSVAAKVEHWTMQYGLASRSKREIEEEKTFRRLLVDRPSKWALSHVHNNKLRSSTYTMTQTTMNADEAFEPAFKLKHETSAISTDKLKMKGKAYLSLPELDRTPKPMASMDPGGTTPDGRLILTNADYEDYLSRYRQANLMRLNKSKVKSKILNRLVKDFTISPKLRLRNPVEILTTQSEI